MVEWMENKANHQQHETELIDTTVQTNWNFEWFIIVSISNGVLMYSYHYLFYQKVSFFRSGCNLTSAASLEFTYMYWI